MDVFSTIESARSRLDNERWNRLTPRQKEVAEYASRGFTIEKMAAEMNLSQHTISEHLKRAKVSTGWSKDELAMQVLARRFAGIPFSP